MTKSTSSKIAIKPNMRAIFINAPADVMESIQHPPLNIQTNLTGDFDYIHFFAKTQYEFIQTFPKLKEHLNEKGMLWVSWPKSGQLGTDLKLTRVIELGYNYGLVESKSISIDATWSALKFTHPKKDKTYNNSYGKLAGQ